MQRITATIGSDTASQILGLQWGLSEGDTAEVRTLLIQPGFCGANVPGRGYQIAFDVMASKLAAPSQVTVVRTTIAGTGEKACWINTGIWANAKDVTNKGGPPFDVFFNLFDGQSPPQFIEQVRLCQGEVPCDALGFQLLPLSRLYIETGLFDLIGEAGIVIHCPDITGGAFCH